MNIESMKDPILLFMINNSYIVDYSNSDEIYDLTRTLKITFKKDTTKIKYIVVGHHCKVIEVYSINKWINPCRYWIFEGVLAPDKIRDKYKNLQYDRANSRTNTRFYNIN